MVFIDGSVVNVALPVLQIELSATLADARWVVESYALFLAALLLVGGSLGGRLAGVECSQWVSHFSQPHLSGVALPGMCISSSLPAARKVQGVRYGRRGVWPSSAPHSGKSNAGEQLAHDPVFLQSSPAWARLSAAG